MVSLSNTFSGSHHSGTYLFFCIFPSTKKTILYFLLWSSVLEVQSLFLFIPNCFDFWSYPPRSWQLSNTNFLHLINEILLYLSFSLWMKLLNSMEFIMFSWTDSNPLSFVFCVWFFSFMFWTRAYSLLMSSPYIM